MLNQSTNEFLDSVAARTSTPGGGAVAALTGALACSLARMVAEYSLGTKSNAANATRVSELRNQLETADQMLRRLVSEDVAAYERLSKAMKFDSGDVAEASRTAMAVPLQIAAIASTALACMDELKTIANRHLLSDLAAAAITAEAAANAARQFVLINVAQLPNTEERSQATQQIEEVLKHVSSRAESIRTFMDAREMSRR